MHNSQMQNEIYCFIKCVKESQSVSMDVKCVKGCQGMSMCVKGCQSVSRDVMCFKGCKVWKGM